MTTPQLLTIGAVASLAIAIVLARQHLKNNQGLRRGLGGLLFSALAAVALTFSPTPRAVLPIALLMLGGVSFMVWSLHVEQKRKGRV